MRSVVRTAVLSIAGAMVVSAGPVQAQYIDQQQPLVGSTYSGWHYTQYWNGQTFRPTANTVVGAGVFLRGWGSNVSTTGTLEVQLWDGRPDLGANFLAGGTTSFSVTGAYEGGSFFDAFWGAVAVTPGNQYWLGFYTGNTGDHVVTGFYDAVPNSYADGGVYWEYDGNIAVGGFHSDAADLAFRQYSATPPPGGGHSTVPEPVTMTLVGTGLAAVVVARRRRRTA